MIRETIRSLFTKGSFTQDVAIVSGGKVLVVIIGFLFIPILSRIYTPEAYGNFSMYNAIVSLLVLLFSLSFPSALVVAKDERTFYNLFSLSSLLLLTFSLLTLVLFLGSGDSINNAFNVFENSSFLFFIPLGILLDGGIAVFTPWNVRRKQFLFASIVSSGHNLIIRIINLIIGIAIRNNNFGLIAGNQAGRLLAVLTHLIKNFKQESKPFFQHISISRMVSVAKEYKNYPLYFLPGRVIGNLKNQSAIYFIGLGFSKSILGNFSIAVSVLNVPIQILANSLSSVFLKKANDLYNEDKKLLPSFINNLITKLFILGVLPFAVLSVFGEYLVTFFLGDQWPLAGRISAWMGPYFFLSLIISPVLPVFQVMKREQNLFIFNLTGFVLNTGALLTGYLLNDIEWLIILFTASNVLIYIIQGIYIFKLNQLSYTRFLAGILIIYPITILILYYIKHMLF